MPTEFEFSPEFQQVVDRLIASCVDFAPLRDHEVRVKSCLKIRLDDDEQPVPYKGDPVTLHRCSPVQKIFMEADYYLIADYGWFSSSGTAMAPLHKALMRIHVKVGQEKVTLATRSPEIQEFTATIRRYGPWTDQIRSLINAAVETADIVSGIENTPQEANQAAA